MNDLALLILLITALLNALGAVLAWGAKLWWSREFASAKKAQIENLSSQIDKLTAAKDETIKAKEAQIDALCAQIEELKYFTPMKMREYFQSTKETLEEYIDNLKSELQGAQIDIENLQGQIDEHRTGAIIGTAILTRLDGERDRLLAHEAELENQLKLLQEQHNISEQALSLIEGQQALSLAKGRRDYWDKKAEISISAMFPSDWKGTKDEFDVENNRLLDQVWNHLEKLLDVPRSIHNVVNKPRHILEVGVGRGDLTLRLMPEILKRGYKYSGVDVSPKMRQLACNNLLQAGVGAEAVAGITDGLATRLTRNKANSFALESIWLVIWGKLGIHLTSRNEWETALDEVKRVLEPGGYFILYEPLQDHNEQYKEKPRKHKWTLIRSQDDYNNALHPLQFIESSTCKFISEIYTVAIWQKRK